MWTEELCREDSDQDGRTNGEELGDPDCTWEIGNQPTLREGITHPGKNLKNYNYNYKNYNL